MDVWGREYIDLVVPGFIEFQREDDNVMGSFQFGTVSGDVHWHLRKVEGVPTIEWSWQGQNDMDPGCGRGWATIVNEELIGRIFIHGGDDSAFKATKQPRPAGRPKL